MKYYPIPENMQSCIVFIITVFISMAIGAFMASLLETISVWAQVVVFSGFTVVSYIVINKVSKGE